MSADPDGPPRRHGPLALIDLTGRRPPVVLAGLALSAVVLSAVVLSAVALAAAPALMPDSYSWVTHTTSESAAQAVHGAWLARLGFLLFGLSVIGLAFLRRHCWGGWAAAMHTIFGALMTATAAFSTRSWVGGADFDPIEDLLHSVAASTMGLAFALGVAACSVHQRGVRAGWRLFDVVAVTASVVLPLGMAAWPEIDGVLQRAMFAIAYLWYGAEAARTLAEYGHTYLLCCSQPLAGNGSTARADRRNGFDQRLITGERGSPSSPADGDEGERRSEVPKDVPKSGQRSGRHITARQPSPLEASTNDEPTITP